MKSKLKKMAIMKHKKDIAKKRLTEGDMRLAFFLPTVFRTISNVPWAKVIYALRINVFEYD